MESILAKTTSIADKVTLAKLSFGVIGNVRKIKRNQIKGFVGDELAPVSASATKHEKKLLDSPELRAIVKADGDLKRNVEQLSLPYSMGFLMVPNENLSLVNDLILTHLDTRPSLVDAFIGMYKTRQDQAELSLGTLHNPSDYLTESDAREKFYFEYAYLAFEVPEQLKLNGLYEQESAKLQSTIANVTDEITILMRESLLELVSHLKSALEPNADGKPKRLFASAVTNIQDFLDTFKSRNITNDSDLESLTGELAKVLHPNFDVAVVKADSQYKDTVHTSMAEIAAKLTAMIETVPGRKFRLE